MEAKGGKQNIENEYTREVTAMGKNCKDPCEYLRGKMARAPNAQEKLKIKTAMKDFNCDGKDRYQ